MFFLIFCIKLRWFGGPVSDAYIYIYIYLWGSRIWPLFIFLPESRFPPLGPKFWLLMIDAWCMLDGSWLKAHGQARGRPGPGDPGAGPRSRSDLACPWVPGAGPAPGHEPWALSHEPWTIKHASSIILRRSKIPNGTNNPRFQMEKIRTCNNQMEIIIN